MNTAMFLQTMLEVLKYDSKFKDKKSVLLPILRRAKINNLPQWEFVRGGRSGQRYENVELRVPVPLLDEANAAFDEDNISVGDYVIVPVGKDNHHSAAEVVKVEYFAEEDVPLPLDRTKHIIRKCTDEDFDLPEE